MIFIKLGCCFCKRSYFVTLPQYAVIFWASKAEVAGQRRIAFQCSIGLKYQKILKQLQDQPLPSYSTSFAKLTVNSYPPTL